MEERIEEEVLEVYEVKYADLRAVSECVGVEEIKKRVMETLGPMGPGLLSITAVPYTASALRLALLPLAPRLALLHPQLRSFILKEHKLGSDVPLKNPDRNVSSFAMQLKYDDAIQSIRHTTCTGNRNHNDGLSMDLADAAVEETSDFEILGHAFKELGYFMMELGLSLARICDCALGGDELERSLLESGTAKGRLLHYHSAADCSVLREYTRKSSRKGNQRCDNRNSNGAKQSDLWQQWHYDYGVFTVLTEPLFLSNEQDCLDRNQHSQLRIFDPNKNKVLMVKTAPGSFIIQVGESADVLSKGKLRSTLHCVSRPLELGNISRETFVVFLQPAWSKKFMLTDYNSEQVGDKGEVDGFSGGIDKIVPPLSSRLKDGMTFAEFAQETTRQYYGGGGLQSNR